MKYFGSAIPALLKMEAKQNSDTRAKCKYGKDCYRKNADHLKRFSHFDDEDDEIEEHEFIDLQPPTKKFRKEDEEKLSKKRVSDKTEEISDKDARQIIKENFGINMPQDFYDLWEYCKELSPENPQDALKVDLNLELVGPYDVLAGKHFRDTGDQVPYSLHYRYFYDPPEFVTVLKGDETLGLHIGYYRDEPDEKPVLVASNEANSSYEFKILGGNIFAGISNSIKNAVKQKKSKEVQKMKEKIETNAKERNYLLETNPPSIKKRTKNVVAKTFHKMGVVVPLDENGVGYRDLQISNAELKKMLTDIVNGRQREQLLDELQAIVTRIQFANDECDYGMGLELGLDLFSFGHEMFHKKSLMLLSLAYELLGKTTFAQIVKSHLEHRDKDTLYAQLTSS